MKEYINVFSTDHYSDSFVNINNCAAVQLNDHDYKTVRKRGRSDYLLMYIARGKCYAIAEGKEYIVNRNQAFIYHPNESQNYRFFKKDNSIDYWFHFNGTEMDNIMRGLGLYGIHHLQLLSDTFEIEQMLSRICREFNMKQPRYLEICSGLLIAVLGMMSRSISENSDSFRGAESFVEHILGEFHSTPSYSFVIKELAQKYGITPNHLICSFKKTTGKTPIEYMTDFRIKKAKELLIYSNYSVSEIAEFVGYANEAYFSRLFKKKVGLSPLRFKMSKTSD